MNNDDGLEILPALASIDFNQLARHASPLKLGLGGAGLGMLGLVLFLKSKTKFLGRDLHYMRKIIAALIKMKRAGTNWTVVDMWEECVAKYGPKPGIVFVDQALPHGNVTYTYEQMDKESNKVANWALGQGVKAGDVVSLMMDNRPEFIFAWLGVAKIGGAIALINTNLRGKPLEHSYRVSGASLHIIGAEHCSAISPSLMEEMGESSKWFRFEGHSYRFLRHSPNETSNEISNEATTMMTLVDPLLEQESTTAPTKELRKTVGMESTLFLIYTSGTTGPPKAARCPHIRFGIVSIFPEMCGINHKDRLYCPLPLYHSAGGIIGVGSCWYTGATLVLRRKFSRTHFWEDISKHECTAFQYIGELCRYLLAAPEGPYDKQHNVKWAVGNGLRPDIWEKFQQRFNIQNIGEFYAATEGNVGFFNPYNKVGAVGYLSPLLRLAYPAKIVRFDHETEMPYRDPKTGFCVECKDGEEGELLGLIKANDPSRKFAGYTDSKATEKKVLRDVFVKGDMYFRSGDLLKFDSEGYVYFVDRIGDTFRWKGENVATTEVAAVIGGFEGVAETNVYGVRVGNADGKAGMALIIPLEGATIDLDKFYNFVMAELPSYAAPLFLRLRDSGQMDTTSTFKHKKADLVNEGFNPDLVNNDKLYYRDDRKKAYVPVSRALYQDITQQHLSAKL